MAIRLLSRDEAARVVSGAAGRKEARAPEWAVEYPLEGDGRACEAYVSRLPPAPDAEDTFGYYEIVTDGEVVGGVGFHGPPRDGLVEVGYGVVPAARRRGIASAALRLLLDVAAGTGQVARVCGRTEASNVASRRVMEAAGMKLAGSDIDLLRYERDLSA